VPLSPRSSQRAASRYEAKKRDTSTRAIAILVGLGLVCLVLVAILVYVLMHLK
jgi:Na+-transporting NADH:ubiquinone oxidoreductase subunit NqrC